MSWEQTGLSCRTEPGVRFRLSCLGLGGWAVIYANNTLKHHHCTVHRHTPVRAGSSFPNSFPAFLSPESVS